MEIYCKSLFINSLQQSSKLSIPFLLHLVPDWEKCLTQWMENLLSQGEPLFLESTNPLLFSTDIAREIKNFMSQKQLSTS